MRRLGPLYPGLVALCSLSLVPLPAGLLPTADDRLRAAKWFPAVGALFGASLALLAALLSWWGFVPALRAVIIQVAAVGLTGTGLLAGVAWTAQRVARPAGRVEADFAHWLPGTLAIVGLLAVRTAALMALDPDEWTSALMLSEVVAYWSVLFVQSIGQPADVPGAGQPANLAVGQVSLPGLGMASAIAGATAVLVLIMSGVIALMSTLIAVAAAFALDLLLQRRLGGTPSLTLPAIASTCGMLVLLAFAAAHPTSVSPWLR